MIDISQATLDVIEAIKQRKPIQFTYGSADYIRELEPTGFFGDFEGFEGNDTLIDEHRKFYFNKVTEWHGVQQPYEVTITIKSFTHPTEEEIREYLEDILEDIRPLVYTINPIEKNDRI
jgi:hypothetical protein|tara:strand:+ start:919 stop:1275 length:357 start_codon:yes stop_codon:yes gene_type:complete